MSEDLIETITVVLGYVLLALLPFCVVPTLMGLRIGTGKRKKTAPKQASAFEERLRNHTGRSTMTVDWMDYEYLSQPAIRDLAAVWGWRLRSDEPSGRQWLLHFAYEPDTPYEGPAARLAAELADADIDADGVYLLDPTRYSALPDEERDRIIAAAGWQRSPRAAVSILSLTKEGTLVNNGLSGIDLGGVPASELQQHPGVAERAKAFEAQHGFDPLAPAALNHLRTRGKYWLKWYLPLAALCGLLWFLGVFPLFIGLEDGTDSEVFQVGAWMMLAGTAFALAAAFVSILKRREIGAHFKEIQRMRRVYRRSTTSN
ncbi:hypothetical protein BJF85_12585 [Saccharomonospora sp. CUA-673]|uniref:hypothetical protein n=1 Tax=Saccharomonospora sp. CUA-673 TaxID=1904969 RepID=UPI00095F687A|nr:hypothetical protein [Saccharomonospora sp. CUA-673]OLT48366.1 hypothetical protein BJF85_12585 [Saccharomonospora sp. CUA-673]